MASDKDMPQYNVPSTWAKLKKQSSKRSITNISNIGETEGTAGA